MVAEEPGAEETGRATIRLRVTPVSAARATTGPSCVSQEAKPEPATAEGEIAEAGYDPTPVLVIIGILDDIKEQSNVAGWIRASGLSGPPHTPTHLAGDHPRYLISKRRARRFPRACPLYSKPQPRTEDQPNPLTKKGMAQMQDHWVGNSRWVEAGVIRILLGLY